MKKLDKFCIGFQNKNQKKVGDEFPNDMSTIYKMVDKTRHNIAVIISYQNLVG